MEASEKNPAPPDLNDNRGSNNDCNENNDDESENLSVDFHVETEAPLYSHPVTSARSRLPCSSSGLYHPDFSHTTEAYDCSRLDVQVRLETHLSDGRYSSKNASDVECDDSDKLSTDDISGNAQSLGCPRAKDSSLWNTNAAKQGRLHTGRKNSLLSRLKCKFNRHNFHRLTYHVFSAYNVFGGFLQSQTKSNNLLRSEPKVKFAPEVQILKQELAGKQRVVSRGKNRRRILKKVVDSKGNILCNPNEETYDMYGVWYIISDDITCSEDCPCCLRRGQKIRQRQNSPMYPTMVSLNYRLQAENFSSCLEQAGNYFDGNMLTAKGAAEVFYFPCIHPITQNLNCPAAKTWLFTYALTTLFHDGQPTEEDFQRLVLQFYSIGQECEQVCDDVSSYYQIHLDLQKKMVRLLRRMLKRLRMQLHASECHLLTNNISHRRVLQLSTSPTTIRDNDIAIMMGGIWNEPDLQWGNFKGYPLNLRLQALSSLLNDVCKCVQVNHLQFRFLCEDIKAGKFEESDQHIVNVLVLMDTILKFFARSSETTPTHEKNLRQVVRSFVKDVFDFLFTVDFAVAKMLELRDTMQLCHALISKNYRSTVASFKVMDISQNKLQNLLEWVLRRQYEYKVDDFFRTPFQRILQMFYVTSGRVMLMLKPERDEKVAIEKIRVASSLDYEDGDNSHARALESLFSFTSLHSNPGTENVSMSGPSTTTASSDHINIII